MHIFDHARMHPSFSDPGGLIRKGFAAGLFENPCPEPPDAAEFVAALERSGRMPVSDAQHGVGPAQGSVIGLGTLAVIAGIAVCWIQVAQGAGIVPTGLIGLVVAVLGAVVLVSGMATVRRRRQALAALYRAWDTGWIRFAPARVGAVWLHRRHHVVGQESPAAAKKLGNEDVEFYFKAFVEVFPTNGVAPFSFETEEFRAIADVDANPRGLIAAPSPLDVAEPEFSNGWTVARFLATAPQSSATITTNLSERQIEAALSSPGARRFH